MIKHGSLFPLKVLKKAAQCTRQKKLMDFFKKLEGKSSRGVPVLNAATRLGPTCLPNHLNTMGMYCATYTNSRTGFLEIHTCSEHSHHRKNINKAPRGGGVGGCCDHSVRKKTSSASCESPPASDMASVCSTLAEAGNHPFSRMRTHCLSDCFAPKAKAQAASTHKYKSSINNHERTSSSS